MPNNEAAQQEKVDRPAKRHFTPPTLAYAEYLEAKVDAQAKTIADLTRQRNMHAMNAVEMMRQSDEKSAELERQREECEMASGFREILRDENMWLTAEIQRLKLAYGLALAVLGVGGANCTEAAYLKDAADLMAEVSRLREENRWRDCAVEMPEEWKPVECEDDLGDRMILRYYPGRNGAEWKFNASLNTCRRIIVRWRPLPPAEKGAE